jgi:hypothetical protein
VSTRLRLLRWHRRTELFADNTPYAADVRALIRDWDFLQANYEHLPEFKELVSRFLKRTH